MSGQHVEAVMPPRRSQERGEACAADRADLGCRHELACCHGGHGRHIAAPRSSSQAGLASFGGSR